MKQCVLCDHSIHVNMKLHLASQCTIGQSYCKCYDEHKCKSCKRLRKMRAKHFLQSEMKHKIQNTQRAAKAAAFVALKQYFAKKLQQKKSCVGGLAALVKKLAINTAVCTTPMSKKAMLTDIKSITQCTARIVV